MSEQSIGLCIFLKRPKNRDRIDRFVYLRITANGEQSEVSVKRSWDPLRWDQVKGRAKGKEDDAQSLNDLLDILIVKCHNIRSRLLELDRKISPSLIKDLLLGIENDRKFLLNVFLGYNERLRKLLHTGVCSQAKFQKYTSTFSHTKEFIRLRFGKEDLPLYTLSYSFAEEYVQWLRAERNCCDNTAAKYFSNLKTIVLYAIRMRWININPFDGYRAKRKEVIIIPLSSFELLAIADKQFTTDRLTYVKDIFIFCCYTGLCYIDAKLLKRQHIQIGTDEEVWICTQRRKTGTPIRLPLLPKALEILKRYVDSPKCMTEGSLLPIFSNQKTNEYLKEIAALCGIDRRLTFHMARHTFATTITLGNGVPMETVSKMLGHKSIRQTEHYARVLDHKISEDMKILKDKLN